jgi:3',5'-cyclic AMP phosphodiesterase CpdA
MPITLPPISRRRFLQASVAAAAALIAAPRLSWSGPASQPDPNHLALLSDIHINADRKLIHKTNISMWDHLQQASDEILALPQPPSMVLINGDCAYNSGRAEDYATVLDALKPLRAAGLPVHLGLGNHDDREHLKAAFEHDPACAADLADRRIMRLELPAADWYVLDSLRKTASIPGELGAPQLEWLRQSLDARANRPAAVMLHHQPDERPPDKASGLTDTKPFLDILEPRKQVKAVLFGHTHVWKHWERDGLHLINLPTSAYVFDSKQPAGWVDAHLTERGLSLQLHAITPEHSSDGELLELNWR